MKASSCLPTVHQNTDEVAASIIERADASLASRHRGRGATATGSADPLPGLPAMASNGGIGDVAIPHATVVSLDDNISDLVAAADEETQADAAGHDWLDVSLSLGRPDLACLARLTGLQWHMAHCASCIFLLRAWPPDSLDNNIFGCGFPERSRHRQTNHRNP